MAFYLCPIGNFVQLLQDSGQVLTNGLIWTYAAGTTAPTTTWTDITGGTPNADPIQLNSAGRLPNAIWQQGGVPIKVQFTTNAGTSGAPVFGTQIGPTWDQVSGVDDPAGLLTTLINPASGSGADLVANAMRSYDLIATVRAANVPSLAAGQTLIIDIEGGTIINDGTGGLFYWSASSTAADDGGVSTIKPTAAGSTGRYLRLANSVPGVNGTFTMTVTGCTTSPAITFRYNLQGGAANGLVTLSWDDTGFLTSNSTSFGFSGMANSLQGVTKQVISPLFAAADNTAIGVAAYMVIQNQIGGSAVSLIINNTTGNWTSSGSKRLLSGSFSYILK